MKKTLFLMASLLLSTITFEAKADLFNIGGVRTKIYSFSNKSFDDATQEERAMQTINEISNNGPLNVVYIESEESKVIVQGDKELFCRVKTQYKDGTINISLDAGTYRNLWLQVVVYAPKLKQIKCTGSGDVLAEKVTCTNDEMSIKVTGSARVVIQDLICEDDLDLHITGSGDIKTTNINCKDLDINVTGSGDVMSENTSCKKLEATVGGSGSVKVNAIQGSNASLAVTGSGDIRLIDGEINDIKARVTGSGQILGTIRYKSVDQKVTGSGSVRINQK